MTKDDDGRLEDFWEFNLDLGQNGAKKSGE